MEQVFMEHLEDPALIEQIRGMLIAADKEFIPPISSRSSPTQKALQGEGAGSVEPYLQEMLGQKFLLTMDGDVVAGFMSYRENYFCEYVTEMPNLYMSTCVVRPGYRGGMIRRYYENLAERYPDHHLYTRTWGTHAPHIHVLEKLGFTLTKRLPDHRGKGIDTVYYHRLPLDRL